jgi:hypothetical protein
MNRSSLFTADHHGYYCDGQPFVPVIQEHPLPLQEGSNIACLRLPARLHDHLNWTQEKELALQIAASGKSLLWQLDLGLSSFKFTPEDSTAFFSFSLAIEEFAASLFPEFHKQTFGIALYQGPSPSEKNFPHSAWDPSFLDWSKELDWDPLDSYQLYCIQMLSEYLHRLISFLPDSVLPFALVDVASMSSVGKIVAFFSKDRFEHVQLALKGATFPFSGICWSDGQQGQGYLGNAKNCKDFHAKEHLQMVPSPTVGLYLPQDKFINVALIEELDRMILKLNNYSKAFRIIPEEKLTEQWDGIDHLIVPSQAISERGKRKLLGFVAAGGSLSTFSGTELII